MYKQLAQRRLKNGTVLHVTVLAASIQQDVLPEVHRLNCSWVLQLWYHRSTDATNILSGPVGDQDSLLFTLWNSATLKAIARGSGIAMRESYGNGALVPNPIPYSDFAHQILKKLNELP
jgi:hypothetical protein